MASRTVESCVNPISSQMAEILVNAENLRDAYLNGYVSEEMSLMVLDSIQTDTTTLYNDFLACPCKFYH